MGKVRRLFHLVLALEGVLLFGGLTTAIVGVAVDSDRATGAGLGLAATGAIAFGLDYAAYERSERYLAALREFQVLPLASSELGALGLLMRRPLRF
jgi:hypothetical protein